MSEHDVDVDLYLEGDNASANWRHQAACAREPHRALFTHDAPDPGTVKAARAVCRACAVLLDCAVYATRTRPTWGIWAGRKRKSRTPL